LPKVPDLGIRGNATLVRRSVNIFCKVPVFPGSACAIGVGAETFVLQLADLILEFLPGGARVAKRSNEKWAEDEDSRLLEMRGAGKSPALMAATLKRTVKAVKGRLAMLRARQVASTRAPKSQVPASDLYGFDADAALDEARQMPPGPARTEAIKKAGALRNAAVERLVGAKRGGRHGASD
jgi:hypothetical protein